MKKLALLTLGMAALAVYSKAPTCTGDETYDCSPCNKVPGMWFKCCSTPQSGYCCQYDCRTIECTLIFVDCPLFGDGIERRYLGMSGPGFHCEGNGTCKED